MKITEIIVHEGRGYNHPYESFSNFKQGISLKASIDETESMGVCTRKLQEKASIEMEAIKNRTLDSLKKINSLEDAKRKIEVVEKPVFIQETFDKTTKMESGGSITWIDDIEVKVINIRAVCHAISLGMLPENCVEFKNLKQLAKLNNWKGNIYGLNIEETQRESKRT